MTTDNDTPMRFVKMHKGDAVIDDILVSSFKKYLKENSIKFVVLDPLKKFHSVSENSNSEMDLLVRDVFMNIASELKVVMLILHHTAKSVDAKGARGASTITDTARIAYKLAKKYKKNQAGEIVEDEAWLGKTIVRTIKDNHNIFRKYGWLNTDDGVIEIVKSANRVEVEYNDNVELPVL
jgi:hypothetical protein